MNKKMQAILLAMAFIVSSSNAQAWSHVWGSGQIKGWGYFYDGIMCKADGKGPHGME